MKQTKIIPVFLFIGMIAFGCTHHTKTAHLRIGQFLIAKSSATVRIEKNGTVISEETLKYPTLTRYREMEPGKYDFTVLRDGKPILQKKFGVGSGGQFTLCIFGIPTRNLPVNFQTTNDKLHTIFAGAEAHTPNGEMPKMKLLTDNFQKGKDEAQIRWMHLAPGLKSLSAKAKKPTEQHETDLSKAKYPESVENKALSPGTYDLAWTINGSPKPVSTLRKKIDADSLYSFFVIGLKEKYSDSLKVVTGVTPNAGSTK